MGSFVSALTWRLRQRKNFVTGRSQCVHCAHVLGPLDLVPVFSWLALRGRCRYCRQRIAWIYPVLELVTALVFVGSYVYWPAGLSNSYQWVFFILWLMSAVLFMALAVYDLRWMMLPDKIVWPLVLLALVAVAVRGSTEVDYVRDHLLGALIIWGFFMALIVVSRGRWIGGGDVKLAPAIGLWLGAAKTVVALLIAFYSATLVVVPLMLVRRISRKSKVPFGPFLIGGALVAMLFGERLINWYLATFVFI